MTRMAPRFSWLRRLALRLALGERGYRYMCMTMSHDPRIKTARMVDFVVRKDGLERRFEADWIKTLARICSPDFPPPVDGAALKEATRPKSANVAPATREALLKSLRAAKAEYEALPMSERVPPLREGKP